ncbi:MAG TPA: prepilin-type N-terminal cleavage/methylation domain-containing protein [Lacunisphaera sp.]|nr:prepilin-type N-terminal cleavage/methylation domain-containing protein [Lacunisphaera sp.]
MKSASFNTSFRPRRPAGFTLVEVLISISLGSMVLAGVLSAFLMLARSGIRTSNYSVMETETRRAFEQLGIDARMANNFVSNFTGSVITSFTLTIPSNDLTTQRQVTYGIDSSDSANMKLYMVPGADPTATSGRLVLVSRVTGLTFLRYDANGTLIPTSTTSDAGVKHVQASLSVRRSTSGVAAATQVIRSSAFTLRNISI